MVNTQGKKGSLVIVGTGMTLGSHLTPLSRSYIEQADIVFTLMSDGMVQLWIERMNGNIHNLQQYYQPGKARSISYQQMVDVMLDAVRAGKQVVGAFYGHPGVFADPPHQAIAIAKKEGYFAHMEPGVSAEDCLIADCGIDPGTVGCANFEASQFMFYQRQLDPSAYLILWQVGHCGDRSLARFTTGAPYRELLLEKLYRYYPADHQVVLYEAPTLPTDKARIETIALSEFATCHLEQYTTMLLPPCQRLEKDQEMLDKLANLDELVKLEEHS